MTVVHHFIGYKSQTREKNILVHEKHKRKAQGMTQEALTSVAFTYEHNHQSIRK